MVGKGILSYPSYQHRIWSRVLLYNKELVPHPASFGTVQDLSLLALLVVPVQRGPGVVEPLRGQGLAVAQEPQAEESSV